MFFEYGEKETEYLKSKDARLAEVIESVGHIERAVDTDLFSSVVHHIIGQQISTKAQRTIWGRMKERFGDITPEDIDRADIEELQSMGMTFRKAEYIKDFCGKVHRGEFDLEAVRDMPDDEAIRYLASLKGIGVWTAEMLLLFCLQRPDILSYDEGCRRRRSAGDEGSCTEKEEISGTGSRFGVPHYVRQKYLTKMEHHGIVPVCQVFLFDKRSKEGRWSTDNGKQCKIHT